MNIEEMKILKKRFEYCQHLGETLLTVKKEFIDSIRLNGSCLFDEKQKQDEIEKLKIDMKNAKQRFDLYSKNCDINFFDKDLFQKFLYFHNLEDEIEKQKVIRDYATEINEHTKTESESTQKPNYTMTNGMTGVYYTIEHHDVEHKNIEVIPDQNARENAKKKFNELSEKLNREPNKEYYYQNKQKFLEFWSLQTHYEVTKDEYFFRKKIFYNQKRENAYNVLAISYYYNVCSKIFNEYSKQYQLVEKLNQYFKKHKIQRFFKKDLFILLEPLNKIQSDINESFSNCNNFISPSPFDNFDETYIENDTKKFLDVFKTSFEKICKNYADSNTNFGENFKNGSKNYKNASSNVAKIIIKKLKENKQDFIFQSSSEEIPSGLFNLLLSNFKASEKETQTEKM